MRGERRDRGGDAEGAEDLTDEGIDLSPPDGHAYASFHAVPFVVGARHDSYGLLRFRDQNRVGYRASMMFVVAGCALTCSGLIAIVALGPTSIFAAFTLAWLVFSIAVAINAHTARRTCRELVFDTPAGMVLFSSRLRGTLLQDECSIADVRVVIHPAKLGFKNVYWAIVWLPNTWFAIGCEYDKNRLLERLGDVVPAEVSIADGPRVRRFKVTRKVLG